MFELLNAIVNSTPVVEADATELPELGLTIVALWAQTEED